MGKGAATVTIDKGFLVPHGILKIIEVIFAIICLALAYKYFYCFGYTSMTSALLVGTDSGIDSTIKACPGSRDFCIATGVIFFLATLLLFFLFLFCVPDKAGGQKVWTIIDIVHDAIAIVFFFVAFILACVWAGALDKYNSGTTVFDVGKNGVIALAVFCLLNFILYIISLVFVVMGLKGQKVGSN